jgi:hypothetical protein
MRSTANTFARIASISGISVAAVAPTSTPVHTKNESISV